MADRGSLSDEPHKSLSLVQHSNMEPASTPVHKRQRSSVRLSKLSMHSSMSQNNSSPLIPNFPVSGHTRFPSVSTLASSPPVRASMDSYIGKRPLTQLREHPAEREADMPEIGSQENTVSEQFRKFPSFPVHSRSSSRDGPAVDYDWAENLPSNTLQPSISVAKRRRADKATPSILGTNFASRLTTFSRQFRPRSEKRSSSLTDGLSLHESFRSRSRTSSIRSITTRESSLDIPDRRDLMILPTPRTSYIEEETEATSNSIRNLLQEEADEDEIASQIEHPGLSRTPLLPPFLAVRGDIPETVHSPLQSPKVAETPVPPPSSPYEMPSGAGLPSPPLSTRPSVASFHHRTVVQSSPIPSIALGSRDGPTDEWALRLGHENFSIQPEPYLPVEPTLESCRQLKADWEHAEREFGRHLARTRANYSATSNIAKLTEEKWAAINSLWMLYHGQALEAVTRAINEQLNDGSNRSIIYELEMSKQSSLHEPVPMTQIPSHLVGGKFPNFGDAGIVGPMEVVKPVASTIAKIGTKNRKRGFWRFLQDLIPGGLVSGKA